MKDTLHDRMTHICPHCKEYASVCDHLFVLTNQCPFVKISGEKHNVFVGGENNDDDRK